MCSSCSHIIIGLVHLVHDLQAHHHPCNIQRDQRTRNRSKSTSSEFFLIRMFIMLVLYIFSYHECNPCNKHLHSHCQSNIYSHVQWHNMTYLKCIHIYAKRWVIGVRILAFEPRCAMMKDILKMKSPTNMP